MVFNHYYYAYKKALSINDSILVGEALRRINFHIAYRARDSVLSKSYLTVYKHFLKDQTDLFWYTYLSISHNYIVTENNVETIDNKKMDSLFQKLFELSGGNNFHKGLCFQMLGIYQAHWLKKFEDANQSNMKAKWHYEKEDTWYANFKIKGLKYNMAINHFKNKEYQKAINFFEQDLKRDKEPILKMYTQEWLFKSYDSLKKFDKALYHFKKMVSIKEELDQKAHSRKIQIIDAKYNLTEKQNELIRLAEKNKNLKSNIIVILPILIIVILLFFIVLSFYRKSNKKRSYLEQEKSQTMKKLDDLKNVVIKNHIILKDSTKVYISQLMYIKSEDHYLNIYTVDNEHLIRGKLHKIKEELPPNFIQCHRSYIVNTNFVKKRNSNALVLLHKDKNNRPITIPLSRSHKNNFVS